MVKYDPYTDKFIDVGEREPILATITLDKSLTKVVQVVEVSDASIEKITDSIARKLLERRQYE